MSMDMRDPRISTKKMEICKVEGFQNDLEVLEV
ncbi:unnamed protein product, partial [Vitis vinifera]|uniref:Uncharacterized protein n=1 Tax=Vitis vinifera TaxID=29760 RepID=D7UA78_VITVI